MTEETFAGLLDECPSLRQVEIWRSEDRRPNRKDDLWLNALLRKAWRVPSDITPPEPEPSCPRCAPSVERIVECDARAILIRDGRGLTRGLAVIVLDGVSRPKKLPRERKPSAQPSGLSKRSGNHQSDQNHQLHEIRPRIINSTKNSRD